MSTDLVESAATYLVAARRARRPGGRLPSPSRPADVATALAIQHRVTELLALPVGGWKCSLPTPPRPVSMAPIYAPSICEHSPCPILPVGGWARIEPEIAFVVGRDLPRRDAPYTDAEVRAAIREPRLALELIGPRYADPEAVSFPELLADCVNNQGLFVGPAVPDALKLALDEIPIAIDTSAGRLHAAQGRHPDGHPLSPLVWLVNFLALRTDGLRAGQIVTTGSYCGVVDVPLNASLKIGFGTLGALSVEFVPLA